MIVALDTNIVIYLVEANPIWTPIAMARLRKLRAAGDEIAFCDAGRFECLAKDSRIPLTTKHSNHTKWKRKINLE